MTSWVVFSDLDGCFLNEDYTYQESLPALESLRKHKIPLVLVSSCLLYTSDAADD